MRRAAINKRNNSTDAKVDRLTVLVQQLIDVSEFSQVQLPVQDVMNPEVIDIIMIMKFTGYDDIRSAKKWLSEQDIIPFDAGKKTYVSASDWNNYIKSKTPGSNTLIKLNDNLKPEKTVTVRKNKLRSKAATDFLKNIKSA